MEPPPRLPTPVDPDIEKRSKMRMAQKRKGRRSTILADRTSNSIQKQNLGGNSGNDFSGGTRG